LIAIYSASILEKYWIYFFEKALYILALISLVLFIIQILNFNFLFNLIYFINNTLHIGGSINKDLFRSYSSNIIIYTINETSNEASSFRNCGFAFEPGFFSYFMNLGLFSNLILNKFRINFHVIIFCVAVISTFSTSGLIGLMLIMVFYSTNKKINNKLLFYGLILTLMFFIVTSELVMKKTYDTFTERKEAYEYIEIASLTSSDAPKVSMGRFTGNEYILQKSLDSPIFGHWGSEQNSFFKDLAIPSSFGPFCYTFGFIGFILLSVSLYKSSTLLVIKNFQLKTPIIYFILFLLYVFAFTIIYTTIFWFIPLNYLRKYFS